MNYNIQNIKLRDVLNLERKKYLSKQELWAFVIYNRFNLFLCSISCPQVLVIQGKVRFVILNKIAWYIMLYMWLFTWSSSLCGCITGRLLRSAYYAVYNIDPELLWARTNYTRPGVRSSICGELYTGKVAKCFKLSALYINVLKMVLNSSARK